MTSPRTPNRAFTSKVSHQNKAALFLAFRNSMKSEDPAFILPYCRTVLRRRDLLKREVQPLLSCSKVVSLLLFWETISFVPSPEPLPLSCRYLGSG